MPRVILLGSVPVPKDHPQFARMVGHPMARWVLNHALAQKAAGVDVEVISQAHKASCDFDCDIEGVRVHFLRTFHPYRHLTFYWLDAWRMARLVRKLRPDIVHAHGTEAAYGWAAQRSGLPYCITAQGLFFQILPTLPRKPTIHERFLRWGEHFVLRRAKHVIAKSEYVADALRVAYPRLSLTRIPNTYEPSLDHPLTDRRPRDAAFVGTLDVRKGVHLIAEAVRSLASSCPDFRLHIIGNPPEDRLTAYSAEQIRILRESLGDRLVLHGRMPSKELFSVLDGCGVLLAPSLEEMFGNQLIEGLMCGCHGIVTEKTALAENARRFGNTTVVPQQDSGALANALRAVLTDPPTEELRESARDAIRSYMSPAVVASAHVALYREILESHD